IRNKLERRQKKKTPNGKPDDSKFGSLGFGIRVCLGFRDSDFGFPGRESMDARSGPRVVLAHDWLTGMRGGEKCLEVLCRRWPTASLYTLLHRPGSVAPAIEALPRRTSLLNLLPGVHRYYRYLLPLMPAAVSAWRLPRCDLVVSLSHC